ncbi:MAG: hypothetical protein HY400_06960 [Elusimicrobia bacterium]|nr:hypothetical protein [Elusimicrobiota bacterium]
MNDENKLGENRKDKRSALSSFHPSSFLFFLISSFILHPSSLILAQGVEKMEPKKAGELEEVVIKGEGTQGSSVSKPALQMAVDTYQTIRESLKPNEALLLAESPMTFTWRRSHPDTLRNNRVIQPWRTTFSEQSEIVFQPIKKLAEILRRPIDAKEAKGYQWSLTIADEEGKMFQHFEGKGDPPPEIQWSGKNLQGEWIKAGHAYSAVYLFVDPSGAPHTGVGRPLQFTGIVHQEEIGLFISLDSSILFGASKQADKIDKPRGENLLRSTADLIKRRYYGIPLRVRAYAKDVATADAQAQMAKENLVSELMVSPQSVALEGYAAPFSEQRVDLLLLNR